MANICQNSTITANFKQYVRTYTIGGQIRILPTHFEVRLACRPAPDIPIKVNFKASYKIRNEVTGSTSETQIENRTVELNSSNSFTNNLTIKPQFQQKFIDVKVYDFTADPAQIDGQDIEFSIH